MSRSLLSWFPAVLIAAPVFAQHTERASVATGGAQGNNVSQRPAISADGRFVAFTTGATNLTPDGVSGVMVRDLVNATTSRAEVAWNGGPPAVYTGSIYKPAISGEGRYVAFESPATNLVQVDSNGAVRDVFVRDFQTGTTVCASVLPNGEHGNGPSYQPALSTDGRFVAFRSEASNLVPGDTNGKADIFVRDLVLGQTTRVSVSTAGAQASSDCEYPAISGDGRYVAFDSPSGGLVLGDANGVSDVFVHDLATGTTSLVSMAADGTQGELGSFAPSISADGRFVAFESWASTLIAGGSANLYSDVLVKDLATGAVALASASSAGAEGLDGGSRFPSISPDGRYVAFESAASNLVPSDTNADQDVFVRDLLNSTTARVSVDATGAQVQNGGRFASIDSDGTRIAFESDSTTLVHGDSNAYSDVFVRSEGPTTSVFCFGDFTGGVCPCANYGGIGHGCDNSAGTGGGVLSTSGATSPDSVVLHGSYELPNSLTIFLQSDTSIAPVSFGDGLRCLGGTLRRLFARSASGGLVSAPRSGDLSITARSAALGDPIPSGGVRHYMTYYRDPSAAFCAAPAGSTFNSSNALSITW